MQKNIQRARKREIFTIIILIICFVILQVLLKLFPIYNLGMYNGVLGSLQYGVCLLLLTRKNKLGSKFSILLISIALLAVTAQVLRKIPSSIPGFFNGMLYLITIILINHYNNERELDYKTDLITGALNRKGLYLELEDRIQKKKEFNIIYITLNNFKAINDNFGHAYGDELLRKTIKRLNVRFGKECKIARLSGAEFVILVNGEKDVKSIADRLLVTIGEKAILVVDNNHIDCYATCYAGVARYPKDASDYESLIKYADIAMSNAMAEKSKEAFVFSTSMLEKMSRQIHIESLIKDSLIKKNFYLVYQPQYETKNKKLRGFETLVRMKTDNGESISPGEFIPIAEKNDLILKLDDYVLVGAMTEFCDIVIKNPELIISVNVSAKDFADELFITKIRKFLSDTKFPAKNLEIEITEYCMVTSMDITINNITKLREMGIQIALDDFGTGYTSLDYVSRLPIDLLKIDKSLVDEVEKNKKRSDFVHAVINMGQLMDCEVIAEGVENTDQIECLKAYDCDYIQGFVWGKPLLFDEAKKLIQEK